MNDMWKDPRWQKKRLEIMNRDGWKCVSCGESDEMLVVHHILYDDPDEVDGPWDYMDGRLITLCEICHKDAHSSPIYLPYSSLREAIDCGLIKPKMFSFLWDRWVSLQGYYRICPEEWGPMV